jgi:CMP-N,N'-diacetyllegionaminic acid synthase
MYILGTICARGGSKGIPHKNMQRLGGKPLIAHTLECSLQCAALNEIVVSTDDKQIAAVAREYDFPVLNRPPELATDTASKWDVFRQIAGIYKPDILVDLDTGCPFREPDDITDCLRKLRMELDTDVVATAYEAERNPYFNMVQEDIDGFTRISKFLYRSFLVNQVITRRQDAPPVWSLSPSVFAIRAYALTKYEHWSQTRMQIHVIPRARALDIDTPDDWDYAEWLMSKHHD